MSNKRLLAVDDNKPFLEFIRKVAVGLGYDVECVPDGSAALAMYQTALERGEAFDVVIMDLTVPGGLGGRETLDMMRALDADVRAIASSGYSNSPVMSDFASYGFQGMVTKPYRVEELARTLADVLRTEVQD